MTLFLAEEYVKQLCTATLRRFTSCAQLIDGLGMRWQVFTLPGYVGSL